jgi:hypothetical protein
MDKENIDTVTMKVRKALGELIRNNEFTISRIKYDDKHFGNIAVIVSSKAGFKFYFERDRGVGICKLFFGKDLDIGFMLTDVLSVNGVTTLLPYTDNTDFYTYMSDCAMAIKQNLALIINAFNKENKDNTIRILREIKKKRINEALDSIGYTGPRPD